MTYRCDTCGSSLVPGADGVAQCPRCLLNLAFDLASEATEGDVTLDATSPASPTRMLGPYRLVDILGEGGMGIVWRAEQSEPIRRAVAVKLVKLGHDSAQVLARFDSERQALALLDHPGIAKVLDAGQAPDGRPYFVMELVTGLPVTAYCDEHRLTVRERLELFTQICDAVQHAHQKGIIHRDLKPSNILVVTQDNRPAVKIIDFGVAKATGGHLTDKTLFTHQGMVLGTPEYMSPEQAGSGGEAVDTRTDVYSLGVLLYELLVGARPFDASSFREAALVGMLRVIREDEPPKPTTRLASLGEVGAEVARRRKADRSSLARQIKGELEWIAMRALEKEPARRYASASELAADVKRHLADEAVLAGPPSAAYQMRKFVRRHRFGVAVATAALVALVAFAVVMTVQAERIKREAEAKQQVSDFVTKLFEVSDPNEAQGNSVTPREFLDRGATIIRGALTADPRVRSELMATMGKIYRNLGLYPQAQPLLEQSLETERGQRGQYDPETLRIASEVGRLYNLQGRYKEAEALLRETLEIQKRVLGPEHPDTLKSMYSLAGTQITWGHYEEAEALLRETLDIRKRALGPEHPDTLSSIGGVAKSCLLQGRYKEAEALFREKLEIQKRVLGPEHWDTLTTLRELAMTYPPERFKEAEALQRETLEIQNRVRGPEHRSTLTAMFELANSIFRQGRYAEAEASHREVLDIRKRVLGAEHPDTLESMYVLAGTYGALGRVKDAEALIRETLEIQQRVLGPQHPYTHRLMYNLAGTYSAMGRPKEAEALSRETLEIRRRVLGPEHPETLGSIRQLVALLQDQRRFDEAETLTREVLDIQQRTLGPEHADTLLSMRDLASAHFVQARYEDAEAIYREIVDIRKRVMGPEHEDTLWSMSDLAYTYGVEGRVDEAEALYREILDTRKRVLGPEHKQTIQSMNDLSGIYYRHDPQKFYALLLEILELQKRVLGPEHPDTLATMSRLAGFWEGYSQSDKAGPIYREILEIQKRVLGPEHPDTLRSMECLARAIGKHGPYKEAETLFRRVLLIQARVLGPEHPDTLGTIWDLQNFLQAQRRFDEAEALIRQALDIQKRVLGPEHLDTLRWMRCLAASFQRGRYKEAQSLYLEAIEIQKRVLGPEHRDTLGSMFSLACRAELLGERSDALRYLRDAVEHGFTDYEGMFRNPDFASLRDDPEFKRIVAAGKANQAQAVQMK